MPTDTSLPLKGAVVGGVAGLLFFIWLPSIQVYVVAALATGFVGGTLPLAVVRWREAQYRTVAAIGIAYLLILLGMGGMLLGLYGSCPLPAFSQTSYRNVITGACETFRVNACGQGRPPWYWTSVEACS